MIPIDIHVIEVVVKTNRLCLLVSLKQRARVPESDILDCVLISGDHLGESDRREPDRPSPGYCLNL